MFLKLLDRLSRSLSFRLNLWHAAVFIISACLLYASLYILLSIVIEQKNREAIEARVKEYAVAYQRGGPPALHEFIQVNRSVQETGTFVRLYLAPPGQPRRFFQRPAGLGGLPDQRPSDR